MFCCFCGSSQYLCPVVVLIDVSTLHRSLPLIITAHKSSPIHADTFLVPDSFCHCPATSNVIIMVLLQSLAGTGHKLIRFRPKVGDKLEQIAFDPYVRQRVLYREMKKIQTMKSK